MTKKRTPEEYRQELSFVNPNLIPLENYNGKDVKIAHKCLICNNIIYKSPRSALRGNGCQVCSGRECGGPPEYKNSIWSSKYRKLLSAYMTEKQMKTITPKSNKKIEITCPICGKKKMISPSQITVYGSIGCVCNDNKSYPNKFVYNLLDQLHIDYIYEYNPEWAKNKFYDIYIPSKSLIIENNGMQHYKKEGNFPKTNYQEIVSNDNLKKILAEQNGIKNYCILDCRFSSIDFIKGSIMNSMLPTLLCFKENDIDWCKCSEYASSNLIYECVQLYNKKLSTSEIGEKLHINRHTAQRYLKRAVEIGICDYNPNEAYSKPKRKYSDKNIYPIFCKEKNIVTYTLKQMENKVKGTDRRNIHSCLVGKYKTHKGLHFYYLYDKEYHSNIIKGAISLGYITEKDAKEQLREFENTK